MNTPAPPADRDRPHPVGAAAIHATLAVVGATAGALAAYYSYDRTASWGLAAFAFVMVAYPVGRGGARVLLASCKLHRTLYYALLPALATSLLFGSYALWGQLTLSVVFGTAVGSALHYVAVRAFLPAIAAEERARWRRGAAA